MISAIHENFWELGSQDPTLFARLTRGVRNMVRKKEVPSEEGSHATCPTPVKKNGQEDENNMIDIGKRQDITVNEVSLIDIVRKEQKEKNDKPCSDIRNYMMKRKTEVSNDMKTNNDIRKTLCNKTMIVNDIKEDISEYEDKIRKIEDKTQKISDMKKTFRNIPTYSTSVKERIVKYQELSDKMNDECVRSGGRCHTHSCVLVREIVEKKRRQARLCG